MKLWTALLCAFYLTLDCQKTAASSSVTWNEPNDPVTILGSTAFWSTLVKKLMTKRAFKCDKVMSPIAIEFSMVAYYLDYLPESRSDAFLGRLFCNILHSEEHENRKTYEELVKRMIYIYQKLAVEVQKHSYIEFAIFIKTQDKDQHLKDRNKLKGLDPLKIAPTEIRLQISEQVIKKYFTDWNSYEKMIYTSLGFTKFWKNKFEKVSKVQFFNKKYSGDFITNTGEYYYENNEKRKYEVLEIPTQGGDSQISLYIFLPHIGSNLHSMTWRLAANEYNWLSNRSLVLAQVKVTIPIHITENSTWNFNSILQWATNNSGTTDNDSEEIQKTLILQKQSFKIADSGITSDPNRQVEILDSKAEEEERRQNNKKKGVSRYMSDALRLNFMRPSSAKINFFASRPFMYALVHKKHQIIFVQGYVTNIGSSLADMGGASAIRQRLDP